MYQTADFCSLL